MARTRRRRRERRKPPAKDELPRMLVHLSWGTAFALLYSAGVPRVWAVSMMAVAFFTLLLLEALRLNYRRRPAEDPMGLFARSYARLGRRFMRTHERRGDWVAALASVGGYLIVLALFDKPVAVAAILCAALGDPAARFVGIRLGTISLIGHKSLQGTLAMGLVCFLASRLLGFSAWAALAAAVAAVLSDVASVWRIGPANIDDNLVMPVACALALALARGAV